MKKLFLTLAFITCTIIKAQELPNITPVSPEVAGIGQITNASLNHSTGKVYYGKEVITIDVGNYQLPISLAYTSSGLLAEEIPGVLGNGWALNAGGAISRQVRGRPDEDVFGYHHPNYNIGKNKVIPFVKNQVTEEERFEFLKNSSKGLWDTQPDRFIISFNGLSGSFYLNENKEAIFDNHMNYKVTLLNNNIKDGFIVTDKSGVKYFFEVKEYNQIESVIGPPPYGQFIASWKIKKIEFPFSNDEIVFSYTPYTYAQGTYRITERKLTSGSSLIPICKKKHTGIDYSVIANNSIHHIDSYLLSKITFPEGVIDFINSTKPISELNDYFATLESIEVKDKFDKVIKKYELKYKNKERTRKLLTEIKFNNDFEEAYEYFGEIPEDINYMEQDFWGYYNGNKTHVSFSDINQRAPNSEASKNGMLKKVIHKTKGTTEFEYEGNKHSNLIDDDLEALVCIANTNKTEKIYLRYSNDNFYHYNILRTKPKKITINYKQAGIISYRLKKMGTYAGATLKIEKISGLPSNGGGNSACPSFSNIYEYISDELPVRPHGTEEIIIKTEKVILSAGVYQLWGEISVLEDFANSSQEAERVLITADIKFNDNKKTNKEYLTGGNRLKQIINCTGNECLTKKYKYVRSDSGAGSGILLKKPRFITSKTYKYLGDSYADTGHCAVNEISLQSIVPLATFQGSHVLYNEVEETVSNLTANTDNGKTIYKYTGKEDNYYSEKFPFAPNNSKDWRKGKLKDKLIFNNTETLLDSISSNWKSNEIYARTYGDTKFSWGVKVGQKEYNYTLFDANPGSPPTWGLQVFPSHFVYKIYSENPEFIYLKTNKQYSYPDFTQETTYKYDTIKAVVLNESFLNSKKQEIKKEYTYPFDLSDDLEYGRLVEQHRISAPVLTKTYLENILLSTEKIKYSARNRANLTLPKEIQTLKGIPSSINKLETRVIYHKYDAKGNPVEVSKADGTHIVYIWGYNDTYPVAKIENATLEDIPESYINWIKDASNIDNDRTIDIVNEDGSIDNIGREGNLRFQLRKLLRLTALNVKAQLTTYTYDPLVGVTSITDPRGETMYYEYDDFNRLLLIKNTQGNIIKEHKYNYKN